MANINPKIEAEVQNWLGHKSIVNEQKSYMEENIEEIEMTMAKEGIEKYSFVLPDGDVVKITRKVKSKKKLDKSGLAEAIEVDKSELTAVGMVKLAEEKTLTTKDIIEHTHTDQKVEVKIKRSTPKKGAK